MSELEKAAQEIMALVDECPSEPFTFERRQVIDKLETLMDNLLDVSQASKDSWQQVGYDEGYDAGYDQANEESATHTNELEDRINELEIELQDERQNTDNAFTEGYETASRTLGHEQEDNLLRWYYYVMFGFVICVALVMTWWSMFDLGVNVLDPAVPDIVAAGASFIFDVAGLCLGIASI